MVLFDFFLGQYIRITVMYVLLNSFLTPNIEPIAQSTYRWNGKESRSGMDKLHDQIGVDVSMIAKLNNLSPLECFQSW